jgi:hypothetical protein
LVREEAHVSTVTASPFLGYRSIRKRKRVIIHVLFWARNSAKDIPKVRQWPSAAACAKRHKDPGEALPVGSDSKKRTQKVSW